MLTACRRWCQAEPWPGAATHGFIAAAKAVWSYCEPCLCKCFPYLSFNFQSRNNFWNLNLFFSEKNFFLFFMYRMCIARERTLYFTFIRLSFFKAGPGLWLDGGIVPLFTVSEVYEDWKTGASGELGLSSGTKMWLQMCHFTIGKSAFHIFLRSALTSEWSQEWIRGIKRRTVHSVVVSFCKCK